MPIRIKGLPQKDNAGETSWNPDETIESRTVTDEQGYSWVLGPNQTLSFGDDEQGVSAVANSDTDAIVEDTSLGDSRS